MSHVHCLNRLNRLNRTNCQNCQNCQDCVMQTLVLFDLPFDVVELIVHHWAAMVIQTRWRCFSPRQSAFEKWILHRRKLREIGYMGGDSRDCTDMMFWVMNS